MTDSAPATASRTRRARVGDMIATILLMLVSLALASALFLGSLLWAMDSSPNQLGFALGVYGPPTLAILGIVLGVVALVRRRVAFVYPLGAIALSLIVWWIGALLIAS
ncbi:MAG TPA: hypothetical protein VFY91_12510 [Microbacterium sp.]|nr:hypothetical protein [Microbacterium sp.]